MASGLLGFFTAMEEQGRIIVNGSPPCASLGRTRFDRLLLIGQCSVPLCLDALKAAIAEAKKGKDIQRYRDAWECIRLAAPDEPEAQFDDAWVTNTGKTNKNFTHQLEAELKGYKNNLIKESIRIGNRDLGEHLEAMGNLNGAADAYLKMRSDASVSFHVIDTNKHIIGVLLQKRDWAGILAYANKLTTSNPTLEDTTTEQPYQRMVTGLAYLGSERYYEAAACFLDVGDPIICQRYNDVASSNDVATYGGLLALASMDRDALQRSVLVTVSSEPRVAMQMNVLQTVRDYNKEALERLRRMSLAAADLEVKGQGRKGASSPAGSSSLPGLSDILLEESITNGSADVIEGVA
ncbi:hypothetical protein NPX13_g10418 [Xylaria arbuscula]|uniref:26S proteasome regulatory subunit Rpn7 N-terminal domain-containing protein n=1 Tax=Xylaria arbuscula TaxID=114810 RepID=A0A9W8N4T6_9PEZI|nr:hypothetical protein NPX13_g10418 [Xylaria arbuscula]